MRQTILLIKGEPLGGKGLTEPICPSLFLNIYPAMSLRQGVHTKHFIVLWYCIILVISWSANCHTPTSSHSLPYPTSSPHPTIPQSFTPLHLSPHHLQPPHPNSLTQPIWHTWSCDLHHTDMIYWQVAFYFPKTFPVLRPCHSRQHLVTIPVLLIRLRF